MDVWMDGFIDRQVDGMNGWTGRLTTNNPRYGKDQASH